MADSSSEEVMAPTKVAPPKVVDADSSEDESDARVKPASKPQPPQTPKRAEAADDSDDDDSESKVPQKVPRKDSPLARPAAPKAQAAVVAEDSSSEDEVAPKAAAKPLAKAPARPLVETDSEDESMPARAPPKAQAVAQDSDDDSEDEAPPAARKAAAPAKPEVHQVVKAEDSDDSDDSETEKKPAPVNKGAQQKGKEPVVKAKAKLDAEAEEPKSIAATGSKQKGEDVVDELRVIVKGLPFKMNQDRLRKDFSSCGDIKAVKVLVEENGRCKGIAFINFETPAGVKAALSLDGNSEKYEGRKLGVERAMKSQNKGAAAKKDKKDKKHKKQDGMFLNFKPGPNDILNAQMLEKMTQAQERRDFATLESLAAKLVEKAKAAQKEAQQSKKHGKDRHALTVFVKGLPLKDFSEEDFKKRFQDCGPIMFVWMPQKAEGENKGFGKVSFKTDEAFQKALAYNGTRCKGSVLSVVKSEPPKQGDGTPKKEKQDQAAKQTTKRKDASNEDNADEVSTKQAKKKRRLEADAGAEESAAVQMDEAPRKEKKQKLSKEKAADEEEVVPQKVKKSKKEKTAQ